MKAIQINGLTKKYKDTLAVDRLTFSVEEGETLALLGVNGAGKSTTVKMLTGLCSPDEGDALLFGKSIREKMNEIKTLIGVSPQETAVARNLSVFENLVFMAELYGAPLREAQKSAEEKIEEFGLKEKARSRAGTLSGGMQRRLSIAMALISRPKLLFLDEPTLGLDVLARRELWKLISGLKGKATIVLATHYMEEAAELADSIAVMARGRLKAMGTLSDLLARTQTDTLEDAFVRLASE